jgi:hypothetical protein
MAAGAGVVVIESEDLVEEEQPAEIRPVEVEFAAEAFFQFVFDTAGEAGLAEDLGQLIVQLCLAARSAVGAGTRIESEVGPGADDRGGGHGEGDRGFQASHGCSETRFVQQLVIVSRRNS